MSNRIAVVTGISSGIGYEIVKKLSKLNFVIIGVDNKPTNHKFCDLFLKIDLNDFATKKNQRDLFLNEINKFTSKQSKIDLLINNAAYQFTANLADINQEEILKSINVNYLAPFLLTQLLLNRMRKGDSSVINICSIHSNLTKPKFSIYANTKSALLSLTKSLSVEYGKQFSSNAVLCGAVETMMLKSGFDNKKDYENLKLMHPNSKILKPEQVAKCVEFLIENQKFLNGVIMNVDGGISSMLSDPSSII